MSEIKIIISADELSNSINNLAAAISNKESAANGKEITAEKAEPQAIPVVDVQPPTAPSPGMPATVAMPVSAPTYALEDIARAGTALLDAGKINELCNLLGKYQVEAITALDPAQYGAFATDLRALGAQL